MKFLIPILFTPLVLFAQTKEIDRYYEVFFRGAKLGPQNFNLNSPADALFAKGLVFSLEAKIWEMNNQNIDALVKTQGEEVYTEFTNYIGQFGTEAVNASFLTMLGEVILYMLPYKTTLEATKMRLQAKDYLEMAIKKDPAYFNSYLVLAQWYFKGTVSEQTNVNAALDYLQKAQRRALQSFQKYQVHIERALIYEKENKKDLFQQEMNAATAIYPNGSLNRRLQADKK